MNAPAAPKFRSSAAVPVGGTTLSSARQQKTIRIEKPEIFSRSLKPISSSSSENVVRLKLVIVTSYLFSILSLVFFLCAK